MSAVFKADAFTGLAFLDIEERVRHERQNG